ncbi:hypothetical protein [Flavobacterium sp. 25HG05S-40]|uniref:hypothetical protein n=1 Tax=Flavobacterium sp. 25HG05S-40 TaxID=3458682 RepID=UPI004043FABF
MSNINQAFNDREKFILWCQSPGFDDLVITEPIGWKNDDKEFARNEEYHGIFPKFSNSLKFIENGAEYINYARDILGINAPLGMTKYEKHPQTDRWTKSYWGYLDMSTWGFEDNQVSIKFNSGGLEQLIKTRESETVEIDRLDTMDGDILTPIQTNEVLFEGRRIFLKSIWEANNDSNPLRIRVYSSDGNTRYAGCGFPLTLKSQSHEQAQSTLPTLAGPGDTGSSGRVMLALFDRSRTVRLIGSQVQFKPTIYDKPVDWAFFKVCITSYRNGTAYELKDRRVLFHAGYQSTSLPNVFGISGQTFQLNFDETFNVDEGDSVALEFYIGSDLGASVDFLADLSDFSGKVFCEEDSFFEPSKSKFVFVHDLFDRLATICSSKKDVFYSKYFGRIDIGYPVDGPGAFVGSTHGFWIRGFDKLPISTEQFPNLFKSFKTSLKDLVQSTSAVFNVGMGIEEINNKERIRIEPLSYFYNSNVTIKLPNQVKKLKRTEAVEFYCSAIDIGYDNGGVYSEAQGLDEPNGKTNFTTPIIRPKKTFSKMSIYRADSYGKEFARRKPISKFDTLDTQYDEDNWFLDLKRGLSNVFLQRKWQDDFAQQPTGVFAPDTADSLRFSPFNMLLRHGWVIASGLKKNITDYIRFGSSSANSQLKTKLIGGNEYAENGNIIVTELGTPRFVNEWIEFEHECDFDVMQQVQGTTVILGNEIPNFYGTIEFINDKSELEKGFLFNLKPNGKGSWKLLKSNR